MLSLRQNNGNVLEPSAGDGAFLKHLEPNAIGLEVDINHITDERIILKDLFDYFPKFKFSTIIGNPPYVRYQDIKYYTRMRINDYPLDKRTNLYILFMWKCIDLLKNNGELIFITPRDFMKATSAKLLNKKLYEEGTFTHFQELGDQKIFKGFSPNCAIWRWVKNKRKSKVLDNGKLFNEEGGQIWFGNKNIRKISDYFEVKVGAVSGADHIFLHNKGNVEFVYSKTNKTGNTRRMIYQRKHSSLNKHKGELLKRNVRSFNDKNWWKWGREYPHREGERIYVNTKTREKNPFFISEIPAFDGSILALFPLQNDVNLEEWVLLLNSTDWNSLGFVCDGRFKFTQRSLENAYV